MEEKEERVSMDKTAEQTTARHGNHITLDRDELGRKRKFKVSFDMRCCHCKEFHTIIGSSTYTLIDVVSLEHL